MEKNKTAKYLKYAIGEIILVVIGILIALQINNWNENRKVQKAQKGLLINLFDNLGADSIVPQENKQAMIKITETQKQLHAFRKGLIKPDAINNPQSIRGSIRNYSITQTNHPDIATKVFNETLKERIRPYLAENLALNSDFLFDNQVRFDNSQILNLEQFYKVIREDYFSQILFESNLKAIETVVFMNEILSANDALRLSIKNEINF
jgi:hypothetical protein